MEHKIVLSNEDSSFMAFVDVLYKENIVDADHLRGKKAPARATAGNKLKAIELEYMPLEG